MTIEPPNDSPQDQDTDDDDAEDFDAWPRWLRKTDRGFEIVDRD